MGDSLFDPATGIPNNIQTSDTTNLPSSGSSNPAGGVVGEAPSYDISNRLANHAMASDLVAQEQGSRSLDERLGDVVTKGIPLTGAAVVNSFINTAVEVGNVFGGDFQKATIADEFGEDSDTTSYYNRNSGVIEGAALVAGSFIPGLGAVKVLKLAQASSEIPRTLQIATGLFSTIRDDALAAATTDLAGNANATSLFGLQNVNKIKTVLAGAADQALQGAVFETAALATMHASPLLDDSTISDNVSDVISSAAGFGLVGGIFDGASNLAKINRATKLADFSAKTQQIVGALGDGDITPGDRIVNLFKTKDVANTAPEGGFSPLQQANLDFSNKTADRQIAEQFIKLAGGDTEVGYAMASKFQEWKEAGMDDETLGNNLSLLSRVGRLDQTSLMNKSSDVIYFKGKVDPNQIATAGHGDFMSRFARNDYANSFAYTIKDRTVLPTIARETDTLSDGTPAFNPKTPTADAWKQNFDIFLDKKGIVHVNPDSLSLSRTTRPGESRELTQAERVAYNTTGNLPAGREPLNAVGLTMDLKTRTLYGEDPLPVIGDIGKPQLSPQGLLVKNVVYPNTPKSGVALADISGANPLQANARFVWAAQRGLKTGDQIASDDIPLLEQLYREVKSTDGQVLEDKNLETFSDTGEHIPGDADELLDHIINVKQQAYHQMLADGKDADTIGQVLNAPQKALSNDFNAAKSFSDVSIDPAQHETVNHVRLAYDIGTTKDQQGNLLRGLQATAYRIKLATDANTTAVASYLGKVAASPDEAQKLFSAIQFTKGSGDADIAGAGAGLFTNADGDYGTLAQQSERIGRTVSAVGTRQVSKVASALVNATEAIKADPVAGAEWGMFRSARQSTSETWSLLDDSTAAENGLPSGTVYLSKALKTDSKTGAVSIDKSYVPQGFQDGAGTDSQGLKTYYTLSQKVLDVEKASNSLYTARNAIRDDLNQAQGLSAKKYDSNVLYAPPIDTNKQPFYAYVRSKEGYMMGGSDASVVTAKSAQELQTKIGLFGPQYEAFTDKTLKEYKAAQAAYDSGRTFNGGSVTEEMSRQNILNNAVPETRADNLVSELFDWHSRQEMTLLRDHVEAHNAVSFAQLNAMGDKFSQTQTSVKGFFNRVTPDSTLNPFNSYIRTALGVGAKDNYPFWGQLQGKASGYIDHAFNVAQDAFGQMAKGIISPEEASKMAEKFGLGNPYGTGIDEIRRNYYGGLANSLPPADLLSKFVGTANSALGASVIRLDGFQQLIHMVTTPILSSLEYVGASSKLQDLVSVTAPGASATGKMQVPGFMRVLYNAVGNYFKDDGTLAAQYSGIAGGTRDELSIHRDLINQMTLPQGALSKTGWAQKIDGITEKAQALVGTNFVNKFNHFIVSDIGRQLGEASGQSGQDLNDTIGTFANRALGNQAAGQRAAIFTGPIGQAIGLFQSYQMNMMQQLFRNIGEGNTRAIAVAAGMQSTIFGLSSLPGFQALNQIIQQKHGNVQHSDLYSGSNDVLGKEASDYLLYGGLSGLLGTALYSRGDLNPRRATILPINPLEFASVRAGIKVYQTLDQLQSNIAKGGDVPTSLLLAAEHNGLSRPLSGLAEMFQGATTTQAGQLVSTNAGMQDLASIAGMSRLLGGKPLDEAVALDALYRNNAANLKDRARMAELGQAAETSLRGNSQLAPQEVQSFMGQYVRDGGRQAGFNKWMLGVATKANVSAVNRTFENLHSPSAQYLQSVMGGVPLPDYKYQPPTQPDQEEPPPE